ncbi:hypothetical protein SVIO_007470 [Streptomyces violaceusniger]|uniref:nitric oxide dioxygenase n=1 Tax=Streptomyces violaceusniger TaxID=68280 RepID=A0A4D4KPL7_STRVO|nr:hypothetical protein SVIO_007470 [Streptomyces violaceusniger]
MLSLGSAAVIRATLPVVGEALDEITARFYGTMFAEQPELLDGLFNRGNQASGEQRKALAGSIAAFAQALLADPDTRPDALLSRIAHKHAALGVTEDQYTIVHKYLFRAIGDVLGEAATAEVVSAWDEAYWLMAGALIAQEARLYQEARVDPRHPWRRWTVVERREETPDVASFLLRPADDGPLPAARAGQYVSVRVLMPDGIHQTRQYSLSNAPATGCGASPSSAWRAWQAPPRARCPTSCTAPSGPAANSPCRPRSGTWSSMTPTPRSCWCPPVSAAPPWSACSNTSPPPVRPVRSVSCTPTAPRPTTPCAPTPAVSCPNCPTRERSSGTSGTRPGKPVRARA